MNKGWSYAGMCLLAMVWLWTMPSDRVYAGPSLSDLSSAGSERAFPNQFTLVYDLRAGEDGFKLGQVTYTWQAAEGRYQLRSVAQAQGVAALIARGDIIETSEGQITAEGLKPDRYTQTKPRKPPRIARFDWSAGKVDLSSRWELIPAGSQDMLSFPFHLALTMAAGNEPRKLSVADGRRLKHYQFRELGTERLKIGNIWLDAMHLRGLRPGQESVDVWLAPQRQWLPVRIRTEDDKGQPMELLLAS